MKVTFPGGLAQYFKPDTKPEMYESLSEGLLPHSELIVYAKTDGIDPKCADWWSPWDKETSKLFLVVLDDNGRMDPPNNYYDILIIKQENGVDVIKSVDDMAVVSYSGDVLFSAGLREDRVGTRDDAVTKIDFVKRLSVADWNYYMDLMRRSDKALRLYHSYAEREGEDRIEAKKSLRPKLAWPIVTTALFLILWLIFDFFESRFVLGISFMLFLPWINYLVRIIRYLMYKP